ncbi:hypothetical protein DID78_06625 [Candidatus Marinamargulisbacteria bacterium SCGC AG-343-D04]|nr:hypothetical protein DID78_06625 [Candidatus Marinamargulisbacteria bacterium SCGC AG-343-D04]
MLIHVWAIICILFISLSSGYAFVGDTPLVESYSKGYAITAEKSGLEGSNKNPASMDFSAENTFILNMNNAYGMDITHAFFGVGYSMKNKLKIGFTLPISIVNNVAVTQRNGEGSADIVETFNVIQSKSRVTLSYPIASFMRIGTSLSGLYDTLYNESATGYAIDVGALIQIKALSIGVAVQDIGWNKSWSTGLEETKDPIYHVGARFKLLRFLDIKADYTKENDHEITNVGMGIQIMSFLGIHGGIFDMGESNQSRAGVSFINKGFKLSYAYGLHPYLGESHKVGVSVDF